MVQTYRSEYLLAALTMMASSPFSRAFVAVSPVASNRIMMRGAHNVLQLKTMDGNDDDPFLTEETTCNGSRKKSPSFEKQAKQWLTTAAAAATIASTTLAVALPADAAMSGGRMGGSFSAPSRSSGGGGGMPRMGGGGSFRGGGYSGYGGGTAYYSRPYVSPIVPITPFVTPPVVVPYGGGVGAISYSRGPGLFDLLFWGGLGWFAISAVSGVLSNRGNDQWGDEGTSVFGSTATSSALGTGTSVLKLSVALDVPDRDDPYSILSVFDRLANTSDTSSRKGVQNLASQVAVELLRRKSSIHSATSFYQHFKGNNEKAAERTYSQLSVQERSKFEKETISKYGGIDTSAVKRLLQGGDKNVPSDSKATMAVVTLVLNIQGDATEIPTIRGLKDVEDALTKIASNVKVDDCLLGADILWTPEDKNEVLTRQDVIADYPELRSV